MEIKLLLVSDIYDFIEAAQRHEGKISLSQGGYVVDGKSLLGIVSLDLRTPINCEVEDGDYSNFEQFVNKL